LHEARGVPLADALSARLKVPSACADFARIIAKEHTNFYCLPDLTAAAVVNLLKRVDALRRPERFVALLQATQADTRGRGGDFPTHPTPWYAAWLELRQRVFEMDNSALIARWQHEPAKIPEMLHQARCNHISAELLNWQRSQKNQ
jgi:tRNA nucleotidyltransferase (CCA-adding enzyme)